MIGKETIWGIIFILVVVACETTQELVYESTVLNVKVNDDLGEMLPGVTVNLFDDLEAYELAKESGVTNEAIANEISNDEGIAEFRDIDEEKVYYLYITHQDRERFTDLDNFSSNFLVSQNLEEGATTNVTVDLEQAKSIVSFYVANAFAEQFPIVIYIGGDSVGVIQETLTNEPNTPFLEGTVSYRLSVGTNWWATSSAGCLYAGSIQVTGVENFDVIELTDCSAGSMTFWVDKSLDSLLPIEVVLDQHDLIGNINSSSSTSPQVCFSSGGLSVGRENGVYTYRATSTKSGCVAIGQIAVEEGECHFEEINLCTND